MERRLAFLCQMVMFDQIIQAGGMIIIYGHYTRKFILTLYFLKVHFKVNIVFINDLTN